MPQIVIEKETMERLRQKIEALIQEELGEFATNEYDDAQVDMTLVNLTTHFRMRYVPLPLMLDDWDSMTQEKLFDILENCDYNLSTAADAMQHHIKMMRLWRKEQAEK